MKLQSAIERFMRNVREDAKQHNHDEAVADLLKSAAEFGIRITPDEQRDRMRKDAAREQARAEIKSYTIDADLPPWLREPGEKYSKYRVNALAQIAERAEEALCMPIGKLARYSEYYEPPQHELASYKHAINYMCELEGGEAPELAIVGFLSDWNHGEYSDDYKRFVFDYPRGRTHLCNM